MNKCNDLSVLYRRRQTCRRKAAMERVLRWVNPGGSHPEAATAFRDVNELMEAYPLSSDPLSPGAKKMAEALRELAWYWSQQP